MSGFAYKEMSECDNPFGDPNAVVYGDAGTNAAVTGNIHIQGLDDYNPFENDSDKNTARGDGGGPAVLMAQDETLAPSLPPTMSAMAPAPPNFVTDDLERRQKELEEREIALQRREEKMRQQISSAGNRAHNWPPLPSFCPFQPCYYQDIDLDISIEYRRIVTVGYYLWIGHAATLLLNIIAALAYLIGSSQIAESASTFGLSIIFAILFIPLSFACWFRPLYKAFRSNSSFFFFLFFIVFALQILIIFLQALGINYFAGCGWINSLRTLADSKGAGAVMLIVAILFTILCVCDVLLLMRVHRIYRGTGASFAKAKQEFSSGIVQNNSVQRAAQSAGTEAMGSAFRY